MTLAEFKVWFNGQMDLLKIYKDDPLLDVVGILMVIKEKLATVDEHEDCDCSKCLEKVEQAIYDASRKFAHAASKEEDCPPEFHKTFKENFKDILA